MNLETLVNESDKRLFHTRTHQEMR